MKLSEIKEILNHMSIEEKVVQLCGVSGMDIVHLLENGTFSKRNVKKNIRTESAISVSLLLEQK